MISVLLLDYLEERLAKALIQQCHRLTLLDFSNHRSIEYLVNVPIKVLNKRLDFKLLVCE